MFYICYLLQNNKLKLTYAHQVIAGACHWIYMFTLFKTKLNQSAACAYKTGFKVVWLNTHVHHGGFCVAHYSGVELRDRLYNIPLSRSHPSPTNGVPLRMDSAFLYQVENCSWAKLCVQCISYCMLRINCTYAPLFSWKCATECERKTDVSVNQTHTCLWWTDRSGPNQSRCWRCGACLY